MAHKSPCGHDWPCYCGKSPVADLMPFADLMPIKLQGQRQIETEDRLRQLENAVRELLSVWDGSHGQKPVRDVVARLRELVSK